MSLNALRRRGLLEFESLDHGGRRSDDAPFAEIADARTPTPEDEAVASMLRDEIDQFMLELPIEQRVAVVLRDMYGYDVAEVAEMQRCGISAAKMRISRGREYLRRRLGAMETST